LRARRLLLLLGEAHTIGPESGGDLVPAVARLDVAGVVAGHRPIEAVLGAVAIDPAVDGVVVAASGGDVDRLAMAVAAHPRPAAVHRVAGAGRKPGGDALAIIVAERAQHRPADAGVVHGVAGVIELFAEIRIHAANRVVRHGHAHALGRFRILPGEIAGAVL